MPIHLLKGVSEDVMPTERAGRTLVIGLSRDFLRDRRALCLALDAVPDVTEVVFVHVVVLIVGQLTITEYLQTQVKRAVGRYMAPLLQERNILYRTCFCQATSSMFAPQPHSYYIGHLLAREAQRQNGSALVVGGSGHEGCLRRLFLGSRVSARVLDLDTVPIVCVGRKGIVCNAVQLSLPTAAAAA